MRTPILRLRQRLGTLPDDCWQWRAKLTPPQREALELQLQGCSLADIAAALNTTVPAVRSRLTKVRQFINLHFDATGLPQTSAGYD
jgi:DNA-binding NarL/FixJ family response regulator